MKVLQVGKYYYPYKGGMETYLYDLCSELRDKVDLQVIVSNNRPYTVKEVYEGINILRIGRITEFSSTSICPTYPYHFRKQEADIVHIHFPNPFGEFSYLLSKHRHVQSGSKLVVSYHFDVVRQKKLLKIYSPVINKILKRADSIIVHSENYMKSSSFLRDYQSKCTVIPIGIDIDKFSLNEHVKKMMYNIKEKTGSKFILFIGRLIYYKGLKYLIDAMRDIDTKLVIIGSGPLRKELEKQVRENNLVNKVIFAGKVTDEEKIAYLHLCELLVLPSCERSEAFGIVQLEAMACEKPVVSTDVHGSGISFVNQDNFSGLIVPPKDSEALANSINTLLTYDELRLSLGRQACERVKKEFSKQVFAGRIYRIYKDLLGTEELKTVKTV